MEKRIYQGKRQEIFPNAAEYGNFLRVLKRSQNIESSLVAVRGSREEDMTLVHHVEPYGVTLCYLTMQDTLRITAFGKDEEIKKIEEIVLGTNR